ncbi:alpha-ketoglutarate-dependent dioxygenase AlkB [Sphingomonas flavescens]|uniref:alpha-ketoglutarate-dependent dioxygenase AlkB n=1 Tax=Sphingomonas flavescens TaxID=3132797 RepID=UPI0028043DA0|nr:alpha-ketoglutarate-dependent dioxygenase AlkB [Sphingomonas limnosediminicola]
MSMLFDTPLIEGLSYRADAVSGAEQEALLRHLSELDVTPFRFQGWLGNRKTHSFGWRYDFDDASFARTEPIPDWLQPLRDCAADIAECAPEDFVHALVARYDPGAGIGWHRDRDVFDKVVGFSFASDAVLRFRQRAAASFRRVRLEVEPSSAYLLSGEARYDWEHSIAPGEQLRFSVTFRTLSAKGRRVAAA